MEHLNNLAHARLRDTAASENVGRVVGDFLRGVRGEGLEEADGAAQVGGLFGVGHVAHLVGDLFEPGLVGFAEGDHSGQPGYLLIMFPSVGRNS